VKLGFWWVFVARFEELAVQSGTDQPGSMRAAGTLSRPRWESGLNSSSCRFPFALSHLEILDGDFW
jgi:hypothetical protein